MNNANWNSPPTTARPPSPPMPRPDDTSIETSEADALPWTPDSSFPTFPALVAGVSTEDHLRAQVLVLAALLGEALPVLKNVEAEGCDEAELLQHTITRSEAAVEAVLREHGVGVPAWA